MKEELHEYYVTSNWLLTYGGFVNHDEISTFTRKNSIRKDIRGYPLGQILAKANILRKNKLNTGCLKDQLTAVQIEKEKVAVAIKLKNYIERSLAIDRIRTTLQAVANKIRYSIKTSAPRVCGIMSVQDIENILTESYNLAIEQLEREADSLEGWETYGISLQQARDGLVTDTEESASSGSGEEDTSIDKDEHPRENRSFFDTLHN